MLIANICAKLDFDTLRAFEESLDDPSEMPTLETVTKFLLKRYRTLSLLPYKSERPNEARNKHNVHTASTTRKRTYKCVKCNSNEHPVWKCDEFLKLNTKKRIDIVKQLKLCSNCLSPNHKASECTSKFTCRHCKKRHHTEICFSNKSRSEQTQHNTLVAAPTLAQDTNEHSVLHAQHSEVILPTIMIKIKGKNNQWIQCRALLGTGAGDNYVTERMVQLLSLKKSKISTAIKGIGDVKAAICKATVELHIKPRFNSKYLVLTSALVLPKLTSLLPQAHVSQPLNNKEWAKLTLADPTFNQPGQIDLILSATFYANIIKERIQHLDSGLRAQDTDFGWIIFGNTLSKLPNPVCI
ncbi:uncharacterized protein DMENIID0001_161420 [Sergentomyia squamirostris]